MIQLAAAVRSSGYMQGLRLQLVAATIVSANVNSNNWQRQHVAADFIWGDATLFVFFHILQIIYMQSLDHIAIGRGPSPSPHHLGC
jgi:hypothetical protein